MNLMGSEKVQILSIVDINLGIFALNAIIHQIHILLLYFFINIYNATLSFTLLHKFIQILTIT